MSGDRGQAPKILIDEDLSPWVAHRLRVEKSIDAVHVRDRGRLGRTDREVLELAFSEDRILITASAKISAQTGVEMEALTAVAVAALTIYDMCKAVDKEMQIEAVRLVSKTKK